MMNNSRKMKDSGIEWIGEIPQDWSVARTKNCYRQHKIVAGEDSKNYERLALTLNGVIKRSKTDSNGLQPEKFDGYQVMFEDDLVFKLIDLENVSTSRVGHSPYTGIVSPAYIVVTKKDNVCPRYGYYYFLSMWLREVFNHLGDDGVRSNLNSSDLLNLPYLIPKLSEQQAIAAFLDSKCQEIDNVLTKTRSSIEEYKKLKQAVITEAVTKGIRGKRAMKDSGIEWIGEIPDNWKVSKVSRIGRTSSGATPLRSKEGTYFDNAVIRWVRTLDLNDGVIYDSSEKITENALNECSCSIMPLETVCVAMYGGAGTIGKCGILAEECATNQAVCSIVCDKHIMYPQYLLYQLIAIKPYWMIFAVGTRKDPNISQDIVSKMKIVLPMEEEQKDIAAYLDSKCNAIDTLISKKEQLILELESYKKSLIYEYVTGKKEVHES